MKSQSSCASEEELIQYLDGELSVNRCRELDSHLAECSACAEQHAELRDITASLGAATGEFTEPDLAPQILARARQASQASPAGDNQVISLDSRRRKRRRIAIVSGVGLSLAAAAALLLVVVAPWMSASDSDIQIQIPGDEPPTGFSTRGADAGSESWRALWVYRRVAKTTAYEEVSQTIRTDDALVFGYLEASGRYPYLMIFGVSSTGEIYWYYPAYEREGENPESISIKRGRHELKAEIEHDLKPGALRVVALFSKTPLRVQAVERAVGAARRASRGRWRQLPLADTEQLFVELKVTRARTVK